MGKILYYNGNIVTAVDEMPAAGAVLTENGVITKVYPGEAESRIMNDPEIEKKDLQGNTLVPGFIDGHSHFLQNAWESRILNASPSPQGEADSVEQLIASLKKQAEQAPYKDLEYLEARGYDEAVYPDHRLPTRYDLDQVTDKPLALTHVSGHNTVLNSAALKLAGITDDYIPPQNGSVERFPDGTLTGIFYENARQDVLRQDIGDTDRTLEDGIEKTVLQYVSRGVTTAQDGATIYDWYISTGRIADSQKLPIDLVSYLYGDGVEKILSERDLRKPVYRNHYRAAGLKIFLDGSPQAKTAWLSKPYKEPLANTDENYCGYGIYTDEQLEKILKNAVTNHWQVNVHTNGDQAIEQLISVYQKVQNDTGIKEDLRPVSIHCQTVREDQLQRMKEIGMLASFFVDHVYYWGDYHRDSVLGETRAERISPLASARKYGISFSLHQDTPVTKQDPLFAIHNAVNRKTRSGKVLGAQYRITPWEALKAVTINAAYQIFEEKEKGTIEEGKRADFVILSDNPLTISPEKIREIDVLQTIKDGEVVYDLKNALP